MNQDKIWSTFSCLLQHTAWKQSEAIFTRKDKGEVNKKEKYNQEKKEASYKNQRTQVIKKTNTQTIYIAP